MINSDRPDKYIVFKNRLYPNYDQIYSDSNNKFFDAHFYAPRKLIFGNYINTYVANIIVLWVMSIIIYLVLIGIVMFKKRFELNKTLV